MRDLLEEALTETLSMLTSPFEKWNKESPDAPFGPSLAAGDEFGSYRTSNKAMNALAQIADDLQANDSDANRTVSQDAARLEAATTLGELLNELAQTNDPTLNWKRFKKRLKERLDHRKVVSTHYFPVWIFLRHEGKDFDVGPVTFRTPSNWLNEVERRKGSRSAWMEGVSDAWAAKLPPSKDVPIEVRSVARSVRADQWVACVTVDGFERSESYRRALIAVRSALDTMRLIVPPPDNARIVAAADHGPPFSIDRLSQVDGQDLAHGASINWRGISGEPTMVRDLIGQSGSLREAAGKRIAVTLLDNPTTSICQKLSERWVNAIHWYGRGCSEEADFAAVVNFVVALDILSGGLMEKGILELTARLMQVPFSKKVLADGTDLKQFIGKLYGYRSQIAHGSILALDERLRAERSQTESLTSAVLVAYVEQLDTYVSAGGADDRDAFSRSLPSIPPSP